MNKIICKWLINNSLKDLFDIVEHNSSTETETLLHREFVVLTNFLHKWSAFCIPLIWSVTHSSYVSVLHITCRYSTHVKNYVHKYTQQPSVCSSSKSVDIIFIALSFVISQFAQLSVLTTESCVFSTKSCKQGLQSNPQLSGNYWDGREKCIFPDQLAKISLQQLSRLLWSTILFKELPFL